MNFSLLSGLQIFELTSGVGREVEIKGCKNFHNGGKTVATTKQEWFKKGFKTAGKYYSLSIG